VDYNQDDAVVMSNPESSASETGLITADSGDILDLIELYWDTTATNSASRKEIYTLLKAMASAIALKGVQEKPIPNDLNGSDPFFCLWDIVHNMGPDEKTDKSEGSDFDFPATVEVPSLFFDTHDCESTHATGFLLSSIGRTHAQILHNIRGKRIVRDLDSATPSRAAIDIPSANYTISSGDRALSASELQAAISYGTDHFAAEINRSLGAFTLFGTDANSISFSLHGTTFRADRCMSVFECVCSLLFPFHYPFPLISTNSLRISFCHQR
jgi:hypothetical protein